MAVLVGDHVCLRERPSRGAEPRLELVEEAEVDVDVTVGGTVEGAGRGGCLPAAGRDGAVEEPRPRRIVVPQRAAPVLLDAVDDGEDPAVLALVRVLAGLALRERRRRRPGARGLAVELVEAGRPPPPPIGIPASSRMTRTMMPTMPPPPRAIGVPPMRPPPRPRRSSTWDWSSRAPLRKRTRGEYPYELSRRNRLRSPARLATRIGMMIQQPSVRPTESSTRSASSPWGACRTIAIALHSDLQRRLRLRAGCGAIECRAAGGEPAR